MMKMKLKRPASAMIELIFAIVVMGIVLMSAPMLITQATNSGYTSTQQESIAAVATHMSLVLSRQWDEQNTLDTERAKVLVTTTDAGLANGGALNQRAGIPLVGKGHRIAIDNLGLTKNASASATFGQQNPNEDAAPQTFDDMDDYHGTTIAFTGTGNNAAGDYIERNLQITTTVNYLNANNGANYNANVVNMRYDNPFAKALGAGTSNIKHIRVRFRKDKNSDPTAARELDKDIILDAFACNIGSYDFEESRF